MKYFNTGGPCRPEDHYMLPASSRLPELRRLIDQKAYFVIHAPRQSGKTTMMRQLARELTTEGRYVAALVSMETGAAFNGDIGAAELAILGRWRRASSTRLPDDLQPPPWPEAHPGERISAALHAWAGAARRPLVVFLDEIDALQDQALISVLRQLRDGYQDRPQGFPWSLALIGLRDVRDYKIASGDSERLNTTSLFNILTRSLTLENFSAEEVATLYRQHMTETGQVFTDEAMRRAFELTLGQPYLTNALAKVAVEELQPDVNQPIALAEIEQAKEILIERQETHLDSLIERLREPRIRNIIGPIAARRLSRILAATRPATAPERPLPRDRAAHRADGLSTSRRQRRRHARTRIRHRHAADGPLFALWRDGDRHGIESLARRQGRSAQGRFGTTRQLSERPGTRHGLPWWSSISAAGCPTSANAPRRKQPRLPRALL